MKRKPRKYQVGGREPIYTSNLKDPRLKAYNDSLDLHNKSKKLFYDELYKTGANFSKVSRNTSPIPYGKKQGWDKKAILENLKEQYTYVKEPIEKEYLKSWSKERLNAREREKELYKKAIDTKNIPTGYYPIEGFAPSFKKPVQPVIYKKPEAVKPQEKKSEFIKKVEQVAEKTSNEYSGNPVYANTPYSRGAAALIGFENKGDTTYIAPEDYERFAVPNYGRKIIESNQDMKKKLKKYQIGGNGYKPPKITEDDIYLLEKMDREARISGSEATPVKGYTGNASINTNFDVDFKKQKYNVDSLGLASGILKGSNMAVGAVADFVNESRNRTAENKQYYSSLRDTEESEFIQNDVPLYTKFGGGFPRDKAMKILRDGKVNGRPLSKGQKKFFATMAFRKAMEGLDMTESPMDMFAIMQEGGELEEMKEGGMPQRYKAMGFTKTDTPKRTPSASKSHAVVVKDGGSYKLIRFGQQGVSGSPKKDGESESYKNRRESFKARHAKNIAKGKTSAAYWADKVKWQEGGDIPEVMGLPDGMEDQAWIEAEAGEVYKQPDGQVLKISDDGDRHEEGGEYISNVEKVLEDTSTSRRDVRSRSLAVNPEAMKALFGIDVNKKLSHSEALEVVSADLDKNTSKVKSKLTKVLKVLDSTPNNKYAKNSLEFNVKELQKYPSKEEIFDTLFNHQESLKEEMNMKQAKYGIALPKAQDGLELLYKKASAPGAKKADILAFQKGFHADTRTYGFAENLVNQRKDITNYGKQKGYGKGHVGQNEDGLLGDTTKAYFDYFNQNIAPKPAPSETDEYDMVGASTSADYDMSPINNTEPTNKEVDAPDSPTQAKATQYSEFNEPLRWTDIMAPAAAYLSADRIPAKYNSAEFKKVDPRLENVLPYLQQGQRDFNTVAGMTENTGAGQANLANVFAQKYAIDNQTRAAVNDRNLQRQGAADIYNAQVSDKQSVADQQSRAVFEQQQLMGIEAQRKQKLQSLDEILQRVNLNRKQNREGNLLMKLFPNFNSRGEFNGNNRYSAIQPNTGGTSAKGNPMENFVAVSVPDGSGKMVDMLIDKTTMKPVSLNSNQSNGRSRTGR